MPGKHQEDPSFASLISMDILRRAVLIALLLGSVLTLANQRMARQTSAARPRPPGLAMVGLRNLFLRQFLAWTRFSVGTAAA